eukprot:2040339-Rhodomonas_salina.1
MPKSFWPEDKGEWIVECVDTKEDESTGEVSVFCSMIEGPVKDDVGEMSKIPVSTKNCRRDFSICTALKINYPNAATPQMILQAQAHFVRVYGALATSTPVTAPTRDT